MSDLKIKTYAQQSLLATGILVVNPSIANRLYPEHWGTLGAASSDFLHYRRVIDRVAENCLHHLFVEIDGQEVEVFARSTSRLGERLEELTGLPIGAIRPHGEVQAPQETKANVDAPTPSENRESNYARNRRLNAEFKKRKQEEARQHQEFLAEKQKPACP
ncbi:hypothetical protein [Methylomarinum vadi]|uniref:hypothetical protein n=1 Tax=Methylomarinum vadi TaxID=438855 RepID=UPI0004DFA485|nr:hypothetical protein [Methylomarinum vadi]